VTGRPADWTPVDDETFDSAHDQYRELRARCPVPWSDAYGGFWSATTYADVVRVATDSAAFSTATQNVVPAVPRGGRRRPPLHFDPPEHRAYRAPLDRVFRRRAVDRLEDRFAGIARSLVDPLVARGHGDFSRDFALPYAIGCFAAFLDLDDALMARARAVGVAYSFAIQDMDRARVQESSAALYAIAGEIVARRRADPRDPDLDMVSSLLAATADPDAPISEEMVVASVRQIIAAGMGAPHAVIGSAVAHLARDPGLQDRLRAEPGLVPDACEELLRMYAPYRVFARTAVHDVELGDRRISAGEAVTMLFPSANRDESVFPDPDRLVLGRRPNAHLAFGRGAHRCPAAAMARLELRCALEELLGATAAFALDGRVEMFNWLEFGPASVPLRLDAAPVPS
jgi:cytochrome P450